MSMRLAFLKKALREDHGIDLDAIQKENERLRATLENITHLTCDLEYYPTGQTPFSAACAMANEALGVRGS